MSTRCVTEHQNINTTYCRATNKPNAFYGLVNVKRNKTYTATISRDLAVFVEGKCYERQMDMSLAREDSNFGQRERERERE